MGWRCMSDKTLQQLIDLIGGNAAFETCLRNGGKRIYFGTQLPIIKGLNEDQRRVLQKHYRDDVLDVPLAKRQLALWLFYDRNISILKTAQMLQVSRPTILRWIRCHDSHPSLFDGAE